LAKRISNVLQKPIEARPSPGFVGLFPDQRRVAEGAASGEADVVCRQAALALLLFL